MSRILFSTKDNAEGQLSAGINAATTSIVLKAGEGAEFPQPYTGTASSGGSSTVLNDTGDLANLAVGDFIRNVTDGSWAFVTVAGTNSVTTTRLRGGTDNTWDNGDEWQVNEFAITLETRDASTPPAVTAREKVLIKNRSTDTLTVRTRGYDGSTAQSFLADAWVNLHVISTTVESIIDCMYDAMVRANTNETDIATANTDIDSLESNATFYVAAAGSSNAFTGTLSKMPAAYTTGERLFFKANHTITGSATFNRASLGAKTIKKLDGATNLSSGDIVNGQIVEVVYDGTNYLMVSPLGQSAAGLTNLGTVTAASSDVGASSTAENAMSPTYQGTATIPANALAAGSKVVLRFGGNYRMDAGNLNLNFYLGSKLIGSFLTSVSPSATRPWSATVELNVRTGGATGTFYGTGLAAFSPSGSTTTSFVDAMSDTGGAAEPGEQTSVAFTGTLAVAVKAQFDTSNANHLCNVQVGSITVFNAPA